MTARAKFERALGRVVAEHYGEPWPVLAYVVYAVIADPESAEYEEPFMLMADGQRDFVTRGLIEQCRDVVMADTVGAIAYVSLDEDDDE